MGREIRRVPANWEHPKDDKGNYRNMRDVDFDTALTEWLDGYNLWKKGEHPAQKEYPKVENYWEYEGGPPDPEYCRPVFKTPPDWYQVYQTVGEGTPLTPPFATKEELVGYLVDNGDFWDQDGGAGGWSRKAAEQFAEAEWAPSGILANGRLYQPRDGFPETEEIAE
jgi:hypothetical protein